MQATRTPIEFHFDFLSPYAYIAWTQLRPLASRHGREVVPAPTLLAALLAEGKTRGPAEIPAKRAYIFKDCLRTARRLDIPLALPASPPFNPLLALRVVGVALTREDPHETARRVVDSQFAACWARGEDISAAESVARILADLDGDALVRDAQMPEAKARLRTETERAIANGVFGVPTMRVEGELFWGFDSFENLEAFLAGRALVSRADAEAIDGLRPSAERVIR